MKVREPITADGASMPAAAIELRLERQATKMRTINLIVLGGVVCAMFIMGALLYANQELIKDCTVRDDTECQRRNGERTGRAIAQLQLFNQKAVIYSVQCHKTSTTDAEIEACVDGKVEALRQQVIAEEKAKQRGKK